MTPADSTNPATRGRKFDPSGRPNFPRTMKPTIAQSIATLAAVDRHDADGIRRALAAVPFDALGDDYRSNPEAACRKALRITRGIRNPYRRLRAIDRLLGNHGVEIVSLKNGMPGFTYSNTGDSYAATVILFASGAFRVSSWGDIVERRMTAYA